MNVRAAASPQYLHCMMNTTAKVNVFMKLSFDWLSFFKLRLGGIE